MIRHFPLSQQDIQTRALALQEPRDRKSEVSYVFRENWMEVGMRTRVARAQILLELASKALGLGKVGESVHIHSTNMASGCSLPDYVIIKSLSRWLACLRCHRQHVSCRSSGIPIPGATLCSTGHNL